MLLQDDKTTEWNEVLLQREDSQYNKRCAITEEVVSTMKDVLSQCYHESSQM